MASEQQRLMQVVKHHRTTGVIKGIKKPGTHKKHVADHKKFVKAENEAKKDEEQKEMDWIDYGTGRATKYAKHILTKTNARARDEEEKDIRSRHKTEMKILKQEKKIEKEHHQEKMKHLKAIQKTAKDVATAASNFKKNKADKKAFDEDETEEFYSDESKNNKLELELKKKLEAASAEDAKDEELKDLLTFAQ